MKTKDFPLDIKAVGDDGVIEGMGSVFGLTDSYGEAVVSGAFAESLARHKRKGTRPLMLWQHDPARPIGVWEDLAEDGRGLWAKGRLVMGVPDADMAHRLLKAGALRGLSIGYREVASEPDGNRRLLTKLDLFEISVVSFPALEAARIDSVKSDAFTLLRTKLLAGEPPTLREWERGMREAFGLSHAEAERIARSVFKSALGEPGERQGTGKQALHDLRAALADFRL